MKIVTMTILFISLLACGAPISAELIPDVPEQCDPAGDWALTIAFDADGSCNLFDADTLVSIVLEGADYVARIDTADEATLAIDQDCAIHVTEDFMDVSPIDDTLAMWHWEYSFWKQPDVPRIEGYGRLDVSRDDVPICSQEYRIGGTVTPATT